MTPHQDSTFLYGGHVSANGIRQHFLRYGGRAGPRAHRDAVIVIPGITSPAITWGFVGERLGLHFDTYVLDVRGRGLTEIQPDMDFSLDAQAADLNAFAAAMGLAHWSAVGHSMGARIAIRAAVQQPAGLNRLVLVDPPVSGPGRRPYPAALPWYLDSMKLSRQGTDAEGMRAFCPTWTDEQLHLRAEWLHTCDERAVVTSFEGFHTDDIHADLPKLHVPVLLVTAERGGVVSEDDVFEMEIAMPGLNEVRVPDAGHMIPWDNEEGFYQAFGSFLGATLDP